MAQTLTREKSWPSTTPIMPQGRISGTRTSVEMQLGLELTRSKLTCSRLPAELIPRPPLLAQLNGAFTSPLTLVTAPAGFGKSTLLASWLPTVPLPSAWLSLDEEDNDLALFSAYLIAAVQTVFPESLQAVTELLQASALPDSLRLASTLNNALAELPSEFLLVLDDYHVLHNRAVHAVMSHLLRHVPPPLHLVVASRRELPLPLNGLRAKGQVNELCARDLRFSRDETSAFLQRQVGRALASDTVQFLQERTEGWPAALRFAALLLGQGAPSPDPMPSLLSESDHSFLDYLLTEVVGQQSPALQQFLLQTALLDDLTPTLGDAVLDRPGNSDTHALWDEMLSLWQDALLLPLEGPEPTYRYHPLLREFLRGRAQTDLEPGRRVQVHRRAAEWYALHGWVTAALKHTLAAGDVRGAARLVEEHMFEMLDQEREHPLLEDWLGLFPPEWRDQLPELLLARLLLDATNQKAAGLPPRIARLEQHLAGTPAADPVRQAHYAAGLATARTSLAVWTSQPALILDWSRQALEQLPAGSLYLRGNALLAQATALQIDGHSGSALQQLTEALQADQDPSPQLTLRILNGVALVHLFDGHLSNMALAATAMLRLAKDNFPISAGWAHYLLGLAHYEWNHLSAAAQHFEAAVAQRDGLAPVRYASLGHLAQAQQAQGLHRLATATWETLTHFTDQLRAGPLAYQEGSYRARLDLLQGDTARAVHWAHSAALPPQPHLLFEVEAHLTRLHAWAAARQPEHAQRLLADTQALLAVAEREHNTWRRIELEALQAVALDQRGQTAAALEAMQRSVNLAEGAGDYVRTYVEVGPRGARLLNLLLARRGATAPVQRILAASVPEGSAGRGKLREGAESEGRWIEPLTRRELQVMEQLAQRRMDKEIAEALVISPLTVKAHTEHIYRKLGVKSRQEAVQVALAFGLLDQPAQHDIRL